MFLFLEVPAVFVQADSRPFSIARKSSHLQIELAADKAGDRPIRTLASQTRSRELGHSFALSRRVLAIAH